MHTFDFHFELGKLILQLTYESLDQLVHSHLVNRFLYESISVEQLCKVLDL